MKNKLHYLLIFFYAILTFLSIHSVNSLYVYIIVIPLIMFLAFKEYLSVAITFLSFFVTSDIIWIFWNRFFSKFLLHYPIASDFATIFTLTVGISYFSFKKIQISRLQNLLFLILVIIIYPYAAYNLHLYYIALFIICCTSISVFKPQLIQKKSRKLIVIFTTILILVFCFLYGFKSDVKSIAILKSQWCDVSKKVDNKSFTMDYFYGYSDFLNLLNTYAPTTIISNNELRKNIDYDALVMITPTYPFSSQEIDNIAKYIMNGGKLIIIADHTNLYGHADNLNNLLHRFHIKINDDSLYDDIDYYKKYMFNINSFKLLKLSTKTNSSLILPLNSKIWSISPKIISEKADYTKENFFGDLQFTEDDIVGNFPVGATVFYGLGSISIWTDSTLFSNFAISQKGNLHLLDYLITGKIRHHDKVVLNNYKKINIIASAEVLNEVPPKHIPKSTSFSTLISNFSRFDLFPIYLDNSNYTNTIIFMTYNDFIQKYRTLSDERVSVIITDDIPKNNIFGAEKYHTDSLKKLNFCDNSCFYSVDGKSVTTLYNKVKILFAKNVISDAELGTWWNSMPISPYKVYIINAFFNWLQNDIPLIFYTYPSLNKKIDNPVTIYDNGIQKKLKKIQISDEIKDKQNKFIYLGDRKWGISLQNKTIICGPETFDKINSSNDLLKRVIKYEN